MIALFCFLEEPRVTRNKDRVVFRHSAHSLEIERGATSLWHVRAGCVAYFDVI